MPALTFKLDTNLYCCSTLTFYCNYNNLFSSNSKTTILIHYTWIFLMMLRNLAGLNKAVASYM